MSLLHFVNIALWGVSHLLLPGGPGEAKDNPKSPIQKPITTIAFGSGNKEELPQPLWADILESRPQVWIWLGGNVSTPASGDQTLEAKYAKQLTDPGYSALRESTTIIGTWNYKTDCAPATAEDTKRLFLDFMGEPAESARRQQDGVYSAYTYGPKHQQVKIILLDARSLAEPTDRPAAKAKSKGPEADILGEAQWKWLERELRQNPAQLTLIGNSTQIIPEEHPFDKWANHPPSRERLLRLLAKTNAKGVVLLSGDRQSAEISQLAVKGLEQPLFEVTSSGLTLSARPKAVTETNKHRVGQMVARRNFGLIQIDWLKRQALLQVHGDRNETLLSQNISF